MKEAWAKKWVKALRSGKYKQTTGTLREEDYDCVTQETELRYCCLGVLADICGYKFRPGDIPDLLTPSVMHKTGMSSKRGAYSGVLKFKSGSVYEGKAVSLANGNDNGKGFKQIARIIEKHWKEL